MERKYLELVREGDWIIASTPDVDRMNDRVNQKGLSLDNYRKNPVLLYGHSHTDPWSLIGTVPEIEQTGVGLRIRVELREPVSESDPMHIVKALWDSGLLRGASIGFQPINARRNEKGGLNIEESELLEISLTPIPANQNALRIAVKALDVATVEANKDVDDGETTKDAEETEPSGGSGDAPGTRPEAEAETTGQEPLLKADDDTSAQEEAQAELRLAAILADFVSSIRPYLSQS